MRKLLFTPSATGLRQILRLFILLLSVGVLAGCERRPLEDEQGDLMEVPFHIDWSQSGLDVSTIHRVSVWFFPKDGRQSFSNTYEKNITDITVMLPVGHYSIVLFNETIDYDEWESIEFLGTDSYETFRVAARQGTFKGLYSRTDEEDIRQTPDAVASWSMDDFEVSETMIAERARNSRSLAAAFEPVSNIVPLPLTRHMHITAHVTNLSSATRCTGAITNAVGSVLLSNREPYESEVSHVFVMNNRKYDDNNLDGTIESRFLIFMNRSETIPQSNLQLDFEFPTSAELPIQTERYDITDKLDNTQIEVRIDVGINPDADDDHEIILPSVDVSNNVGVDDWENENIPLT